MLTTEKSTVVGAINEVYQAYSIDKLLAQYLENGADGISWAERQAAITALIALDITQEIAEEILSAFELENNLEVEQPPTTPIYDASWDGSSTTTWTRTDDAIDFSNPNPYYSGMSDTPSSPFDNISPWKDMTVSTDTNAGEVVRIPKFWYKLEQHGTGMKIQIANSAQDGFSVSPAHMDRGDGEGERDEVYVGRYHCADDYTSKTGVTPIASITRSTARTSIHNLGDNIWQSDFAMRFTLWLLYIVEFANWDSQACIGYGTANMMIYENMGYTDGMPYHTGTTASDRTEFGLGTQYRNIEGLWDNVNDWVDGAYNSTNGLNIILNPNNFSDSSGGTSIGTPSSGYPSAFLVKNIDGTFPTFIPSAANGSTTTYSCDYWSFSSFNSCLYAGGHYQQDNLRGLFYLGSEDDSISSMSVGCRLMVLP